MGDISGEVIGVTICDKAAAAAEAKRSEAEQQEADEKAELVYSVSPEDANVPASEAAREPEETPAQV